MNAVAFLSYVIITSITPGPSNLLMMNESRHFGFLGAWKFNGGILTGFAVLGLLSAAFTTGLDQALPVLEPYLKWAGVLYLMYLAWKIGFSTSGPSSEPVGQATFLSGFVFQMINVKSILFFLTVLSAFILPESGSTTQTILYLIYTIVLGWAALLLWSAFGSLFSRLFTRFDRIFRFTMSALLIYSAVTIF
ncbi:LysE family translocator [Exiguobacterium oxidotolerans]|uniref:Lysine transporter LysE n=1 Tax=Exiguobacterium oxidotolerans TaxID=223958 RepID=A0A653I6A4_9BACL|nr:LysE family transporter [Exiguobacterium oxidotolerans]VWX34616.1 Lysine transporter LysE [Exiguobacterium oxidotolerans]